MRKTVPQVGVVPEGVVGEQRRHGGTRLGGVEHQNQNRDIWDHKQESRETITGCTQGNANLLVCTIHVKKRFSGLCIKL